jgi:hypothetical protein
MRYLSYLRSVPGRFCVRALDAWLGRAGIEFRKYKVAPRLGAPALRRRLLSRLLAEARRRHSSVPFRGETV